MGTEYARTRHNVGLMCLEYLVAAQRGTWKQKTSYDGYIAELHYTQDFNPLALWPLTFMNIIGKNVAKTLKAEQMKETKPVIVLHDDLEQRLGRFRVVKGTSFK